MRPSRVSSIRIAVAITIAWAGFACDDRLTAVRADVGFVAAADVSEADTDTSTDVSASCDIFNQDCAGETTCVPSPAGTPRCVPAGLLEVGTRCGADSDPCRAGLLCTQVQERSLSCLAICEAGGDPCSDAAHECHVLSVSGLPSLGACDDPL